MEKFYTIKEVADNVKVSVSSVKKWIRDGDLKANKIGGTVRIKESDLINFIKEK